MKPVQEGKTRPLAAFDPRAFSKLIQGRGTLFRWSRAINCSCRLNDDTDQFNPNCTRCGGDGWSYINPCFKTDHTGVDYIEMECVFANVGLDPTVLEILGHWTMGNALLTVQNEARVGYRDRFIGINQVMSWTELRERLTGNDVPVGWAGRTSTVQKGALRYEPTEINYVEADIAGVQTIYRETTDFILKVASATEPAKLSWVTGKGPPVGQLYTIHYTCHPVWVVDDSTYQAQHTTGPERGLKGKDVLQTLPTTFKVALDHLSGQRGT